MDKDLTAALLAQGLGADALLLLTDVEAAEALLRRDTGTTVTPGTPAAGPGGQPARA